MKFIILLVVAALATFVLGASIIQSAPAIPTDVALTPEAARNFALASATAELRPLITMVRATGMLGFNELRLAHITPLARGRVQSVEVSVGDHLATGTRMMVLDALELAEAKLRCGAPTKAG